MSLGDSFNQTCSTSKINQSIIAVTNRVNSLYYDFAQRIVMTANGDVTPFSQMDREVLAHVRDTLVALGGKPPGAFLRRARAGFPETAAETV